MMRRKKKRQEKDNIGGFVEATAAAVDPCNKPENCVDNTNVADPNDCHMYYWCNNNQWNHMFCGAGWVFDSVTLVCAQQGTCQEPCPIVTGSTPSTTTPAPGLCAADNVTNCVEGQKYADRSDCESYYVCTGRQFIHEDCPPSLPVFDIFQLECVDVYDGFVCEYRCVTPAPDTAVTDSTASDNHFTVSACVEGDPCNRPVPCVSGERIAHPENCTQYYTCNFAGSWEITVCPGGLKFDSETCVCRQPNEATCQPPCDTGTGITIPPTPAPAVCDVDNTTTCRQGDKAPDKSSCYHYFQCLDEEWIRQECSPPGTVFDIYTEGCVPKSPSFDCGYRCQTPAPTTEPLSFTTPVTTEDYTTTTTHMSSSSPIVLSTVVTTVSPSAPHIQPDPYIAVTLNGTFYADDVISGVTCADQYTDDFKTSFSDAVVRTSDVIKHGALCTGASDVIIVAGSVKLITYQNMGMLEFNIVLLPASGTFQDFELCAWELSSFLQNFSNWRQPIIDNGVNCPPVTFTPTNFTQHNSQWNCS